MQIGTLGSADRKVTWRSGRLKDLLQAGQGKLGAFHGALAIGIDFLLDKDPFRATNGATSGERGNPIDGVLADNGLLVLLTLQHGRLEMHELGAAGKLFHQFGRLQSGAGTPATILFEDDILRRACGKQVVIGAVAEFREFLGVIVIAAGPCRVVSELQPSC